jgi:hypothetical protein
MIHGVNLPELSYLCKGLPSHLKYGVGDHEQGSHDSRTNCFAFSRSDGAWQSIICDRTGNLRQF